MREKRPRPRRSTALVTTVMTGCILAWAKVASAGEAAPASGEEDEAAARRALLYETLSAKPKGYVRTLAGLSFGSGLRFNNPYRLATQLGASAESPSATAPYLMLTGALAFGPPDGLQHGGTLGLSIALSGVGQTVLTPGYTLMYRGPGRLLVYGRAGPSIVLSPDLNVGLEVAGGTAFFVTGGLGLVLDVAGNLFYGASTWEKKYPTYPVLSASLGVIVDVEFLP
ncbi:hypothetical protein [Polyangium spumosum]|uniref:Outer membrane beta-barrel domain-containing protein n=1 Tax=Polyangium spumosum TaxID=889282 RepID=A0A6N7PEP9_9BACT|nr:hypothetical protein [Polyangium spumosum]MRG90518.1 hypothetical protein [Polyangium spumosum]